MGQGLSCAESNEHPLFSAAQNGEVESVEAMVDEEPSVVDRTTARERLSALHLAAANGQIQVLSMLLDRGVNPDVLNRHKQSPLMLAAMYGKTSCVERLLEARANILMFDSLHRRTCLHYAAFYGHPDCLQAILSAAHSSPVANSWGFARFVNIRDKSGETPLHLAARQGQPECAHVLLDSGALACASTGGQGFTGITPLHLAARSGSLDCVRELLAWGADRHQRDSSGRTPYLVALKHKNGACAALLNPSAPGPLIWPSPLKFIAELNPEAKALLERALMDTNKEREKAILKETVYSLPSPLHSEAESDDDIEASDVELCGICFDQICTIEVQTCGHQMCANCTLALCCHNKPTPATHAPKAPVCPFCRSKITELVVAEIKTENNTKLESSPSKPRTSRKSLGASEGSSSFKGLSALGSFGKLGGRGSGKISAECDDEFDKP
ncbi:hypothetical protein RHMOL_Rhmol05G0267700 [Rhododendron molle]|uniref:Uncharacterized protein n=1 Tax=Rhododendron molle TaxID=49168 RepID=A0ACC0NTC5_RHOML|nr:hypothetical protein RHMOL_Rhmol05G0267700 [Rhododendron molle]